MLMPTEYSYKVVENQRFVSFPDGADNVPMKDCTIPINPVQDLHGQANPYPGGGGINQLNPSEVTTYSTSYGFTYAWDSTNGSITILGTYIGAPPSPVFRLLSVTSEARALNVKGFSSSSQFKKLRWQDNENQIVVELQGLVTNTYYNIVIYPIVYSGSTAPTSWSPYSNICPITGWTGLTILSTNKNLLGGDVMKDMFLANNNNDTSRWYSDTRQLWFYSGSNATGKTYFKGFFKANTQYTFIIKVERSNSTPMNAKIFYTDGTDEYLGELSEVGTGTIVTVSAENKTISYIGGYRRNNYDDKIFVDESGIFEGVHTADDFVACQGSMYSFDWQSTAGTVCCGSLNVLTGVLTVTHGSQDLGDLSYTYDSTYHRFKATVSGMKSATARTLSFLCSSYQVIDDARGISSVPDYAIYSATNNIYINDPNYTDPTAFASYVDGQLIVYPLATVATYQLTAAQVKTILGENNIWTNTGDIERLEYPVHLPSITDYNDAILAGNHTHARVVFPVQDVTFGENDLSMDGGGITISSVLNHDIDLRVGNAVSREVRISIIRESVPSGFDWTEKFHIDFGVDINDVTQWVTVGYFTGSKPDNSMTDSIVEFIAYDDMLKFDALADDFIATLTYPTTLESIYEALCTYVDVPYSTTYPLSGYTDIVMADNCTGNPFKNGLTYRNILAYIAECLACNAVINATGEVEFRGYSYPYVDGNVYSYDINEDKYFQLSISEEEIGYIWSAKYYNPNKKSKEESYPTGFEDKNTYFIFENPVFENLEHFSRNLQIFYTMIVTQSSALTYYHSINVRCIGNWMIESGDCINVIMNGSYYDLPIFSSTLTWNGYCESTYESTGKAERSDLNNYASSIGSGVELQNNTNTTEEGYALDARQGANFFKVNLNGTNTEIIIKTGSLGSISHSTTASTKTFDTAFPTACTAVFCYCTQAGFGAPSTIAVGDVTKTGFKYSQVNSQSAAMNMAYIAIGY